MYLVNVENQLFLFCYFIYYWKRVLDSYIVENICNLNCPCLVKHAESKKQNVEYEEPEVIWKKD